MSFQLTFSPENGNTFALKLTFPPENGNSFALTKADCTIILTHIKAFMMFNRSFLKKCDALSDGLCDWLYRDDFDKLSKNIGSLLNTIQAISSHYDGLVKETKANAYRIIDIIEDEVQAGKKTEEYYRMVCEHFKTVIDDMNDGTLKEWVDTRNKIINKKNVVVHYDDAGFIIIKFLTKAQLQKEKKENGKNMTRHISKK